MAFKRKSDQNEFFWTDDELQLLLDSTLEYKSKCESEGENWESKRSKYECIRSWILDNYPDDREKYPHKESVNKDRVAAKLKTIRRSFRKAVDSGKRNGGGRIVFTFYDVCENIWGGSPTVKSICAGIDSSRDDRRSKPCESFIDIDNGGSEVECIFDAEGIPPLDSLTRSTVIKSEEQEHGCVAKEPPRKKSDRRERVAQLLNERRTKKLATKMGPESQLIQFAREDMALKKKLFEKIEKSNQEFHASLSNLNAVMTNIDVAIHQIVGILDQLLPNQEQMPMHQPTVSILRPAPQPTRAQTISSGARQADSSDSSTVNKTCNNVGSEVVNTVKLEPSNFYNSN